MHYDFTGRVCVLKRSWALTLLAMFLSSQGSSVPVYRFPDSTFPSGDSSFKNLRPNGLIVSRSWLKVQWNTLSPKALPHEGWLPRSAVILDIDLSRRAILSEDAPYRKAPQENIAPLGILKKNIQVDILSQQDQWVLIKNNNLMGWVSETFLNTDPTDAGSLITKVNTPLRRKADLDSVALNIIPEGKNLAFLGAQNSWAKVSYQNKSGWISLNDAFSKLDFTSQVLTKKPHSQWQRLFGISGGWLQISPTGFLRLQEVKGIKTDRKTALVRLKITPALKEPETVLNSTVANLGFGQVVEILDTHLVQWAFSQTKDYGAIWWPLQNEITHDPLQETAKEISTDELFSRGLYDMAAHPLVPLLKFASAQGVYRSTDGEKWTKLSRFGQQNFPIAMSLQGDVYVGNYASSDQGETFHPFLRWDKIISTLNKIKGSMPVGLRLTKIAFEEGTDHMLITLSTAKNSKEDEIRLVSYDHGKNWKDFEALKIPAQSSLLHDLSIRSAHPLRNFVAKPVVKYEQKYPSAKFPN
jgi:uncharacterized protein YgiM (DUF1202 family)